MKKTAAKAALIALAAFIAAASITYLFMYVAFPSTLASVFSGVGNDVVAARIELKAYRSGGKFDSALSAADHSVKSGDEETIVLCVGALIGDEGFVSYSTENRERADFYLSKYFVAKYALKRDVDKLAGEAFASTVGYGKLNPLRSLMMAAVESRDKAILQVIAAKLALIDEGNLSQEEVALLNGDKDNLDKVIARL